MRHRFAAFLVLLSPLMIELTIDAEIAAAQNLRSPEVDSEGRATFRLNAPKAQAASVSINGATTPMTKDERGIWSVTSEPLPPGIHDYTFDVDGTRMIDPANRAVKKWFSLASMVEIPGNPPLLTELQPVPHGAIHRRMYNSSTVGHDRPVMIYTPPGYDVNRDEAYPVVILMHGFGDDETAWTEIGKTHYIADNLLAQGRIVPPVIVMPFGHPVPVPAVQRPDDYFVGNNDAMARDIVNDLLPFVEANYHVRSDAAGRSIVGLSMGGGHALDTGLRHVDRFSAIGAFSAATPAMNSAELTAAYPALKGPDPAANGLRVLWIPIGDRDFLLDRNRQFIEQLKANEIHHHFEITEGAHEWRVWRRYLPEFLMKAVGHNP